MIVKLFLAPFCGGGGNATVVSVSVYQAGDPGSCPPRSTCHRKVEFYLLLTRSHQCRRLVKKRPSMCYHVCIIMHVKDPWLSVVRVGHCVPLAGFCLSLYDLHALNRDANMIQSINQSINNL